MDVDRLEQASPGWKKLNTDDSIGRDHLLAGVPGLIRNNKGEWDEGFTMLVACSSVEEVESWAIEGGLGKRGKKTYYGSRFSRNL